MEERYSAVSPEFMAYLLDGMRSEEQRIDPWEEIQKLARVDPACGNAVDQVRYGRMSKEEATLWLALYQTKRAMTLHERSVELLKLMPMPPIVMQKAGKNKAEGV